MLLKSESQVRRHSEQTDRLSDEVVGTHISNLDKLKQQVPIIHRLETPNYESRNTKPPDIEVT